MSNTLTKTANQDIKMFSPVKIGHESYPSDSSITQCIGEVLSSSQYAGMILENLIGDSAQEQVYALYLDCHLEVIGIAQIALGDTSEALLSFKAIFQHALLCNAENIIVGHNHPTGNLTFSDEDIKTFNRLEKAGKVLGIKVLDFLAVSENNYSSLKENQQVL